jgi:hypothetical protein
MLYYVSFNHVSHFSVVTNTGEKQLKGGKTYSGSVSEVSVQCQVDPLLWV